MRLAVLRDPVAGAVPSVDGAVVQPKRAQVGDGAAIERSKRVFLVARRDERAETRDVLLEDVDDAPAEPMVAEAHTRGLVPAVQSRRADVARLLEERDSRLGPETLAEERRGVRTDRER